MRAPQHFPPVGFRHCVGGGGDEVVCFYTFHFRTSPSPSPSHVESFSAHILLHNDIAMTANAWLVPGILYKFVLVGCGAYLSINFGIHIRPCPSVVYGVTAGLRGGSRAAACLRQCIKCIRAALARANILRAREPPCAKFMWVGVCGFFQPRCY